MTNTVDVTIQLDRKLKSSAEQMLDGAGLSLSTAITVFLKQTVIKGRIPFSIETDSFWSKENQSRLLESLQELNDGKVIVKTTVELEAMENG
jgi:DNA-damage-inducible protein J